MKSENQNPGTCKDCLYYRDHLCTNSACPGVYAQRVSPDFGCIKFEIRPPVLVELGTLEVGTVFQIGGGQFTVMVKNAFGEVYAVSRYGRHGNDMARFHGTEKAEVVVPK